MRLGITLWVTPLGPLFFLKIVFMIRTQAIFCSLLLLSSLCQWGLAAEGPLQAGAAVADITPQRWPVPMVGSFAERLAMRAWDPLQVRSLVLDNGTSRIAFVVVDSCYCPRSLFDDAKRRASEVCGLKPENILASATHTHTAPASRERQTVDADPEYVEHVTRGIVSSLQQATANLAPAEMGWGRCEVAEEVHNRRWYLKPGRMPVNPFGGTDDQVKMNPSRGVLDRPAGPVDPEVMFLAVRTHAGHPIALLANYALHYVGNVPRGGVSADYFGEFTRQIESRLVSDNRSDLLPPFVGIMSNGTSGDINNIPFGSPRPRKKPLVQIKHVASLVADRIMAAMPGVQYKRDIELGMAQSELTLHVRKPTTEQVQQAKEFLAAPDDKKLPLHAKSYARWTMMLDQHDGTEDLIVQAVRVGEVGVTAIPCEVLVEIGLSLKDQSPLQPSFTIELANGHYGYLPNPRQHRLGGYETWLGTNQLEIEASDKIKAELLKLLRQLAIQ